MQTTPKTETREELAPRLRLAVTRMARRLRQEAGTDMGPSQVAALATVERHGPLSPSEVAEVERIKRPTATRIVRRLAAAGLIDRVRDPEDGEPLERAAARLGGMLKCPSPSPAPSQASGPQTTAVTSRDSSCRCP